MFVARAAVAGTTSLGTTEVSADYVVQLGIAQFVRLACLRISLCEL
jgi:hypothetical protein